MTDYIDRKAAIDALWKALYKYEDETEEQFQDSDELDLYDWMKHRIFVQNMSDIDRQIILSLPSAQRWIPCVIKEPDTIGDYLLYRPHFWGANEGQVTVCYWNGHDWSDNYRNDAERYLPEIFGMAWMPLPEPYKGEGEAHEID